MTKVIKSDGVVNRNDHDWPSSCECLVLRIRTVEWVSVHFLSLFFISIIFIVSGCVTAVKESRIRIEGVAFHNTAISPVSDVRLSVEKTSVFVSCGTIHAGHSCSTTFPLREYEGNSITVTWTQEGRVWSSGSFVVDLPHTIIHDRPAMVIINIGGQGAISTELIQ